jgi:hypothetical protein
MVQQATLGALVLVAIALVAYAVTRSSCSNSSNSAQREGFSTTLKEQHQQGAKGLDGATEMIAESALGGKKQTGDVAEVLKSYERYLMTALKHQVARMAMATGDEPSSLLAADTSKQRDAIKVYVEQLAAVRVAQEGTSSSSTSSSSSSPLAKFTWY